jgi:hypothetical protein
MFSVHVLVAEHVPVSGFASAGLGWVGFWVSAEPNPTSGRVWVPILTKNPTR